jgi:hypothetical protein
VVPQCKWWGTFEELVLHREVCDMAYEFCQWRACTMQMMVAKKDMAAHSLLCRNRLVPCKHCNCRVKAEFISKHEDFACPFKKIECTNFQCTHQCERGAMNQHKRVCPKETVTCPNSGCNEKMFRSFVNTHLTTHHAIITSTAITQNITALGRLREEIEFWRSEFICGNRLEATLPTNCRVWNTFLPGALSGGTFYTPSKTFNGGEELKCVFRASKHNDHVGGWFGGIVQGENMVDRMRFKMEMSILNRSNFILKTFVDLGNDRGPDSGYLHDFTIPGEEVCGRNFSLTTTERALAARLNNGIRVRCRLTLMPDLDAS